MKNIKIKTDAKGNTYLDLKDFKGMVDIDKVKKYTLETVYDDGDDVLILKFYDAKGKLVEAK